MTNHQLAAILLAQPELPMYFVSTDPTDWTYTIPIEEKHVGIDEELYVDIEDMKILQPDFEGEFNNNQIVSTITIDI